MAAEVEEAAAPTAAGGIGMPEDIRPYRIHVSSKYLELTKQKLEIARLPHESSEPKSADWWEPKPQVEPLIDFWLEQYSWRDQENDFNSLPQFRTAFTFPPAESPVRAHFIHVKSSHSNAIPLLLIPPFPLTNLSLGHLVKPLADPEDPTTDQPFHLVIPALPGLGFSDALPNNASVISSTGELLNGLMDRLSYPHYLVTNAGSGTASPAEIDYKLANYLAVYHPDSCLGTHLISPPLAQPRLQEAPLEWAKWSIASFFHAPILGYQSEDFSALERTGYVKPPRKPPTPAQFGLNRLGLREPNTLAYALCDSPTGLLVFALKTLRLLGPKKEFTPTEIVNFTQLAWLPGPEAAMRFWAHTINHPEETDKRRAQFRPKVAITVFLGDEAEASTDDSDDIEMLAATKSENQETYVCPSWANAKYHVLHAYRATGKSGLLAWERPEIITTGVRGLATELLKLDARLRPATEPATAPLEEVVIGDAGQPAATDPPPPPPSAPAEHLQPPEPAYLRDERVQPRREESDDTRVASSSSPAPGKVSPDPIAKQADLLKPDERTNPSRMASDDTRVASNASPISAASPSPLAQAADLLKPVERVKPHRMASDDTRVDSEADERSKSKSPGPPTSLEDAAPQGSTSNTNLAEPADDEVPRDPTVAEVFTRDGLHLSEETLAETSPATLSVDASLPVSPT